MGKHRQALAAAVFGLATCSYAIVPTSTEDVHPFSDQKVARFVDYLDNMFNMFQATQYIDDRQEVASDWFTNSSELLGSALNCEMCLGGMKVVQWLVASDFFTNLVINFGDSLCYAIRSKFMYSSCSGYVASSVPAVA